MIVFKIGGGIIDDEKVLVKVLKHIAKNKEKKIIVHGGGKKLNKIFEKIGEKPIFKAGRRITTKENIKIIERVLSGEINKLIVGLLIKSNLNAIGVSCKDGKLIIAKRINELGFVGIPIKVNKNLLKTIMKYGIPVISSIGIDENGNTVNINADEVAKEIAIELKARKLIFFTETDGVLDVNGKTFSVIDKDKFDYYFKNKLIRAGMALKVKEALETLSKGVKEVLILGKNLKGTKVVL
ncbi:MAG: acetylglutamate kinase [bacterium]|nr:acetylglutamate kinase [bacterium]